MSLSRSQPIATFTHAELDAVVRPLVEATNLPPATYTDPRVWAIEEQELFASMWLCVGREEDLPEPGSYFTRSIGGESLLVARGGDGEVRAFHNVCRHRGACLVHEEKGRAKAFRCKYHAWTYDTRGELIAAPMMEERPGFATEDWPLGRVRTGLWGGFVFLNLDDEGPSLGEWMANFPDLERYRLGELRRAHRIVYEVDANWKILCENYSECYHCALVHPQLNRVTDYRSGGRSMVGDCFNGGPMELNEGMTAMSMTGESRFESIAGLTGDDCRLIHYFHLYPHFLLGLTPDYVISHVVWPRSASHSTVICDWLFPPSTLAAEDFDADDVIEFWDVTNRQDWGLCEMVQTAAGSRGARPGPYHPSETCVHAFDSWYVRTLRERLDELAE